MKKALKVILSLALVIVMVFSFASCGTSSEGGNGNIAVITIKDYGTVTVELQPDVAPITVENFIKLSNEGFYNGLTFHRIIKGFMVQGGDPKGTGTGGSDENIKGEFSANGVKNTIKHDRGVISMARSGSAYEQYLSMGYRFEDLPSEIQQDIERAFNSASSQFFIVHEDSAHLDGNYAAFGHVTDGMEVIDKICMDAAPTDNNGTIPASQQPVIESIVIK